MIEIKNLYKSFDDKEAIRVIRSMPRWIPGKQKMCIRDSPSGILSSAEHVKFCVNLPGPSGKAKYSWETDSEPVLWRKGEKHFE